MKFITIIVFAFCLICAVQAQRGFGGPRRGPRPVQGGGPQADCPSFCPANYQPTCGFNGHCYKEFGNNCAFKAAVCNGEGNFRKVPTQECSKRGVRIC